MRKSKIAFVLLGLLTAAPALAAAAPSATVTSADEMQRGLAGAKPDAALFDKILSGVTLPGQHMSIDLLRRAKSEVRALIHDRVTEIYIIKEGGGTFLSGGTLLDPKPMAIGPGTPNLVSIGPSRQGPTIKGGTSRHVGVGDFVVIPPGTPHEFTAVDGHVTYLAVRLDPKH